MSKTKNINVNTKDDYRKIVLSNIKHDLTNPINAILGYSEFIIDIVRNENIKGLNKDVQAIYESGSTILMHINDIFSIAAKSNDSNIGNIIPNSKQIIDGIYFGGDFDTVIQLMHDKKITKNEIRFFVGYSGWNGEQLNTEIRDDAWIIQPAKNKLCMKYSTPKLWSDIIKTKKMKYAIWANMPKDPSLN